MHTFDTKQGVTLLPKYHADAPLGYSVFPNKMEKFEYKYHKQAGNDEDYQWKLKELDQKAAYLYDMKT